MAVYLFLLPLRQLVNRSRRRMRGEKLSIRMEKGKVNVQRKRGRKFEKKFTTWVQLSYTMGSPPRKEENASLTVSSEKVQN